MSSVASTYCASRHGLFIGGEWVESSSSDEIAVIDPSCEEVIGFVPAGTASDIDRAVSAAGDFMKHSQARFAPQERTRLMWKLADAIAANAEEFAEIETLDAGKPISNAETVDVPGAVAALRYFAGWATKLSGETMAASGGASVNSYTLREPVGVVGHIIPWNYPLMGAVSKLAPALAAGCAMVLKPAEQTPLSALRLGQLIQEVGFPEGVVNIVPGYGPVAGEALALHPDVQKISFTGSTATGRKIIHAAADTMKRVTLELGGKSPVVVMPDADLDAAAVAIAQGIFFNTGQTCSAGSRLLVHAAVANDLISRVCALAAALHVGTALDRGTQIGPLVSAAHRDRVMGYIESGIAQGAKIAGGGSRLCGNGYFVQPTVLTHAEAGMTVVDEEIFGPVLCVSVFETDDLDEVADRANDGPYGLSAYVWTKNLRNANHLIRALQSGSVKVNTAAGGDFAVPVGGVKQSGFGRENGRQGVEAYTELKSVTVGY